MAADVIKKFKGTLTTSEATIQEGGSNYTPATGRVFILQGFLFSNANAAAKYAILKVGGTRVVSSYPIPLKDSIVQSNLQIPVLATETITVQGEVATDIDYSVWGLS